MSNYPHQFDNSARLYRDEQDRLWVTHTELLENGYQYIEDFDIVYLNGTFYELQAYMEKPDAWWIEAIPTEPEDADNQL